LIYRKKEVSLRDWLINRFGYTLYNIYFGPYSFKLWGRDPSSISADWAPQRISVPNLTVAIKSLFTQDHREIKTYARRFLYPKGGIGEISNRMAEILTKQGARVFTDLKVCKITIEPQGFVCQAVTRGQEKKTFFASRIISTIPLTDLLNMLNPPPALKILDAVNNLRFRSVRFLNLMLDIDRITENTWMYVPERKYVFFRIQESANWHPQNSPPGKTALTLEIACEKGGRLWQLQDQDLLKICINDLKKMDIHLDNKILGYFSTFAEHAYPVYSLRYKEYLKRIFDYVAGIDNLVVCGRQGLFRYINMDAAIENGFDAAESLYSKHRKEVLLKLKEKKEYLETNLYFQEDE
jgi:protoporphyrinogen oxidase